MPKQKLTHVLNTLEVLADIPKRATKDVVDTFNPLATKSSPETQGNGKNHTPLNVEKIKGQHELNQHDQEKKIQDEMKLKALRNALFKKRQAEETAVIRTTQQQESMKKEDELKEEKQRQQAVQRKLAALQNNDAPQGKEQRGSLFAPKKKRVKQAISEQQVEQRASGKH